MFEKSIVDNNSNGNEIENDYKKVKMHDYCFTKKKEQRLLARCNHVL